MSAYPRPRLPGATISGAAAPRDRGSSVLVDEVDRLREAVRATLAERPFGIVDWAVLPDHRALVQDGLASAPKKLRPPLITPTLVKE